MLPDSVRDVVKGKLGRLRLEEKELAGEVEHLEKRLAGAHVELDDTRAAIREVEQWLKEADAGADARTSGEEL